MARKEIGIPLDRQNRNNHNANYAELYKEVGNIVGRITDEVYDQIIDGSKLDWKEPVPSQNDLPGGAPEGETRMTRDTGKVYRFNGKAWVEIQQIDAGPVSELDSRLSAQLAEKASKSKLNAQPSTSGVQCSIIYDDGYIWDHSMVFPFFKSRGIKGASALIVERVENPGRHYMSMQEINEMKEYGWEFLSHTISHPDLSTLTKSEQDHELGYSKDFFEDKGLDINGIVYPFNAFNPDTLEVVRNYYDYAFAYYLYVDKYINYTPFNQYAIYRVAPEMDPNVFKGYVDEALKNNGWLVLMGHSNYYGETGGNPERDWTRAQQNIDYIISKNIPIRTPREVIADYGNVVTIGDDYYSPEKFFLSKKGASESNHQAVSKSKFTPDINTPLSAFPNNLSFSELVGGEATGFPDENLGGTLVTYKATRSDDLSYQIMFPNGRNRFYKRNWERTEGKWRDFENISSSPRTYDLSTLALKLTDETLQFTVEGRASVIGKIVHVNADIIVSKESTGTNRGLNISGIPKELRDPVGAGSLLNVVGVDLKNHAPLYGVFNNVGNDGYIAFHKNDGTGNFLGSHDLKVGSKIKISGTYHVDSNYYFNMT